MSAFYFNFTHIFDFFLVKVYVQMDVLRRNLCLLLNITTLTSQVYFCRQPYSVKARGNKLPCVIKIDSVFGIIL